MKKIILISLMVLTVFSCTKNTKLIVAGEIEGFNEGYIYLKKFDGKDFIVIDSIIVSNNGKFSFREADYLADLYLIKFGEHEVQFFLDKTSINIQTSIDNLASVEFYDVGLNETYNFFNQKLSKLKEQKKNLKREYLEKAKKGSLNEKQADSLIAKVDNIDDKTNDYILSFVKNNCSSIIAP